MNIVFMGDIHGNYHALHAVYQHAEENYSPGMVVCTGDIVGALGSNGSCIDLVREWADVSVVGNHDTRVCDGRQWIPQTHEEQLEHNMVTEQITHEQQFWLQGLPVFVSLLDGKIGVTHIRPQPDTPLGSGDDSGIRKKDIPSAASKYLHTNDILVTGHTHEAYVESVDRFDGLSGMLINPGSVGLSYSNTEYTNDGYYGKATYAIYNTNTEHAEIVTVEYDSTAVFEFVNSLD